MFVRYFGEQRSVARSEASPNPSQPFILPNQACIRFQPSSASTLLKLGR
jgi:hypothetical protein